MCGDDRFWQKPTDKKGKLSTGETKTGVCWSLKEDLMRLSSRKSSRKECDFQVEMLVACCLVPKVEALNPPVSSG